MIANRLLENIVLSSSSKAGKMVKIKIVSGLYQGETFDAKKVLEGSVYCYHIEKDGVKTYVSQNDVIEQ